MKEAPLTPEEEKARREIHTFALEQARQGATESELEQKLRERGLRKDAVRAILDSIPTAPPKTGADPSKTGADVSHQNGAAELGMFVFGVALNFGICWFASKLLGFISQFGSIGEVVANIGETIGGPIIGMGISFIAKESGSIGFFVGALLGFGLYLFWLFV